MNTIKLTLFAVLSALVVLVFAFAVYGSHVEPFIQSNAGLFIEPTTVSPNGSQFSYGAITVLLNKGTLERGQDTLSFSDSDTIQLKISGADLVYSQFYRTNESVSQRPVTIPPRDIGTLENAEIKPIDYGDVSGKGGAWYTPPEDNKGVGFGNSGPSNGNSLAAVDLGKNYFLVYACSLTPTNSWDCNGNKWLKVPFTVVCKDGLVEDNGQCVEVPAEPAVPASS